MHRRLLFYIVSAIVIFLFFISLTIINIIFDLRHESSQLPLMIKIEGYKTIIFYLNITKSLFYILTCCLTIKERNLVLKEINHSPLLNIDETLTEDLYKNIIEQSQNPKDSELIKTYKRLTVNSKIINESNKTSSTIDKYTNNHQIQTENIL